MRLFDEHIKRQTKSLSGAWMAEADPNGIGESSDWQISLPSPKRVTVPSVWNTELGMLEYEGAVWYEKQFYTEGGTLRFNFGAVMTYAKVYLDGEYLGDHYGGFCRFDFIVRDVKAGAHTLTVKADNSFDEGAIPAQTVDWYHYGGITRDVEVETLCGICVLYQKFDYTLNGDEAVCKVTLELYNAENEEISDKVSVFLDGDGISSADVTIPAGEYKTIVLDGIKVTSPELWSPENPKLYGLISATATDDIYDRVGFRFIETRGGNIYLNGKKIYLRGVNRHEEHADFGMAFPETLMLRDIDIITGAECNAIRGSHYPNNPTFIDMLDERGIFFWSEIPIWGHGYVPADFANEKLRRRGLEMHREMVKEYYNHPSIILWGMHNEIDTDTEEGKSISELFYNFLKKEGGNRLVTYASDRREKDISFEYCDVLSLNMYIGWYDYKVSKDWGLYIDAMKSYFKKIGVDNKPIIMGEFGAAAIYGHHTFDNVKWTEEYQAKLISDCIKLYHEKGFAGSYVWQFSDIRTSKEMGLNRARGFNNKGIVNEYRRPKLAYGAVRDAYKEIKEKK
jgi:beta-glucuronidase